MSNWFFSLIEFERKVRIKTTVDVGDSLYHTEIISFVNDLYGRNSLIFLCYNGTMK